MLINGPWQLQDLKTAVGTDLGVAPLPAGPSGICQTFDRNNGIFVNGQLPSPEWVKQNLVDMGLYLTSQASSQAFTDTALAVPVRDDVTITDAAVNTFAVQAAAGSPWPKRWGLPITGILSIYPLSIF